MVFFFAWWSNISPFLKAKSFATTSFLTSLTGRSCLQSNSTVSLSSHLKMSEPENAPEPQSEPQSEQDSVPPSKLSTEDQPAAAAAASKLGPASVSFTIWPPTQRTRDAVINRLIETLSSQSVLSKRYGTMPPEEASAAARQIEDEAFAVASGSSTSDSDGIEILQVYSKEISKRMLDTVKSKATTGSPAVDNGVAQTPTSEVAPTPAAESDPAAAAESETWSFGIIVYYLRVPLLRVYILMLYTLMMFFL